MIDFNLDKEHALLHIRPRSTLAQCDFEQLASVVDPYIQTTGYLNGLVVEAAEFPGWSNFSAMLTHFRFVHDHHHFIKKVAIVTNSILGDVVEHIASHFVAAEIRHFAANELDSAIDWLVGI